MTTTGHWLRFDRSLTRPTGPPNPFEAYLLVVCAVQGFTIMIGVAHTPTMAALVPHGLRLLWAALLMAGGILAIAGLYWPWNPLDAVLIKRVGLVSAGGGTFAYGAALLTIGAPGVVAAAATLGFSAACFHRTWQVSRAIANFRTQVQAVRIAAEMHDGGYGQS